LIERHGGRPILAASAVLLAAGLVVMGAAPNLFCYLAAWCIVGVGMAGGLYGEQARRAITLTTLYGGFASTVCWPLSAFLVAHVGWRGTCFAYAAINIAVVLPLYWFGVPREPVVAPAGAVAPGARGRVGPAPRRRLAYWLVAGNLTPASVVMTVVSVHMLSL